MSEKIVKVGADHIANEDMVVRELSELIKTIVSVKATVRPYAEQIKTEKLSVAQYMAKTRNSLNAFSHIDLSVQYTALNNLVTNGNSDAKCGWRLNDAIYQIKILMENMTKDKCIVRSDAAAKDYQSISDRALTDLCVYAIEQFHLYEDVPADISVQKFCQQNGITVDVWYGYLLETLKGSQWSVYGYEPMSPYYTRMESVLPNGLLCEMEDNHFPLDAMTCHDLLEGIITVDDVDNLYHRHMAEHSEVAMNKEITPATLMTTLKLGD